VINYYRLRKAKQALDNNDGSKFQRFLKARKYRRISKETYTIVKVIIIIIIKPGLSANMQVHLRKHLIEVSIIIS
jgi:hypothetical protein